MNIKTFESFKSNGYRIYYASMLGQWITQSMQTIVRSLLVYRLTDSAAAVGIISLAQAIPGLLFSLLGGVIADRIPKKYLLTIGRASLAIFSLGNALLLSFGILSRQHPDSWWLLVVTAALQGTSSGFTQPAMMAIIPEIVSEQRVMNAISLSSMGQNIVRLVGPALAGFLIDRYNFAIVFYLMTGLYAMDTIWTCFLPRVSGKTTRKGGNPLKDMADAFRYIRRESIILIIVIFAVCHMVAGSPYMQLLPVFTESILKVSATKLGLLSSVSAVGSLIGSLVFASMANKKRGLLVIISGFVMAIPLTIFAFSHSWYLSLALMPFLGLGPTMNSAMTTTLIQSYADPDYRGRMQGFFAMASGLATFGTFLAGIMTNYISVQWSVGIMAIFLGLASIMFLVFARRLRNLD